MADPQAHGEAARLLATPLGVSLFDIPLSANLYALNAFRLVGVAASVAESGLEHAIQRYRNLLRLSPQRAMGLSAPLGYEVPLRPEDALESVAKLEDPRHRLISELFWPHVVLEDGPSMVPAAGRTAGRAVQDCPADGRPVSTLDQALARHAQAVVLHNEALADELSGTGANGTDTWPRALELWAQVADCSEFWTFLRERAERLDDPRVGPEDVRAVERELPSAVLAWNELFLASHGSTWNVTGIDRHLQLVRSSGFAQRHKDAALLKMLGQLAKGRLNPLIDRLRQAISGGGKLRRLAARDALNPVLLEAQQLRDYFGAVAPTLCADLELGEFDALAEAVLEVVSGDKLDYSEDNPRALLLSVVSTHKLLSLPLSKPMRRRARAALQGDIALLYKNVEPDWKGTDPARCWFLPTEDADSEAAIVLPMYKITRVSGGSVRWDPRNIVIPRSERARRAHEGKWPPKDLASLDVATLDSRSQALVAEIRAAEAGADAAIGKATLAMEDQRRQAESALAHALAEHGKRFASPVARDKAELDRIKADYQSRVDAEDDGQRRALSAARQAAQEPIARTESAYQAAISSSRGPLGLLRTKPAYLWIAGAGFGIAATFASLRLDTVSAATLLAGTTALIFVGLMAARRRRLELAKAQRDAPRAELAAQEQRIQRSHAQASSQLAARARDEGVKATARLAEVGGESDRIRQAGARRSEELRKAHDSAIAQIRQNLDAATAGHRAELTKRLTPRPQSDRSLFPAYGKAKASGYKDGSKPTDSEVDELVNDQIKSLMKSLSESERHLLGLMLGKLDSEQGQQLMDILLDASPSARGQKLLEIIRGGSR